MGDCSICANVVDFFKSDYAVGFLAGVVTCLVLWVVIKLISLCSSKKPFVISNNDEKGVFTLSHHALKDFINKVVSRYSSLELKDIDVKKRKEAYDIDIDLRANSDSDLAVFREKLPEELLSEMKAKLGVTNQIGKINIQISALVEGK